MRPNTKDQKKSNSFHIEFKIFVRHFTLKFEFFFWNMRFFSFWSIFYAISPNRTQKIVCYFIPVQAPELRAPELQEDSNKWNRWYHRKSAFDWVDFISNSNSGIIPTGNCFIKYPYLIMTLWYRLYIIDSGPFQWVNEEMEYG